MAVFAACAGRAGVLALLAHESRQSAVPHATETLLVLPLCARGDLAGAIAAARRGGAWLDGARVARLAYGVACGLLALHSASPPLAHCDLKPANVLLDAADAPRLCDFGSTQRARVLVRDAGAHCCATAL